MAIFDVISGGFWCVTPTLVCVASFMIYTLTGNTLTVAKAFTCLSLYINNINKI